MKKYEQLVWKYLISNKKRTISTILGVAFGALLIFAVMNITFSLMDQGLKNAEKIYYFDAVFYNLTDEQAEAIKNYPGVETTYDGGISPIVFKNTGLVLVEDFEQNPYGIQLVEGTYPEHGNEILVNVTYVQDYEVGDTVFFMADPAYEQLEESMDFVVSGTFIYEGDYDKISGYKYSMVDYLGLMGEDTYEQLKSTNAVFVRYKNQYRLASLSEEISEELGVEYILNDSIALYYNQTSDGSEQAVIIAIILFVVVMISLMAVAVIKNTLRISIAERMKDYGILRCAGASLKQLKKMLVWESMIIGAIGAVIGIIISYIGLVIFSANSNQYNFSHFFLLSVVVTLLAMLVTMLLATIEPGKMLAKLTPVEAVRNQVKRYKDEVYKVRKAKIITKIFGIEGAYAYKNAMRNPKNFIARVFALTIGITLFICTETIVESLKRMIIEETGTDSYYNIVIDHPDTFFEETSSVYVEDYEKNQQLALNELYQLKDVGKTIGTFSYISQSPDIEYDTYYMEAYNFEKNSEIDIYSEAFKTSEAYQGTVWGAVYPDAEEDKTLYIWECFARTIPIQGYDKSLFSNLSDYLVAGTCNPEELGENDIILCNTTYILEYNPETGEDESKRIEFLNYEVGDQVTFVTAPFEEYERRVEEKTNEMILRYENDETAYDETAYDSVEDYIYYRYHSCIHFEVLEDLYKDGYYKIYTIRGIVSDDSLVCKAYNYGAHYIVSTSQAEELFSGYPVFYTAMHADGYNKEVIEILEKYGLSSEYLWMSDTYKVVDTFKHTCNLIMLVVLIFMTINIFNTTSSSMVFRKGEFALLRCVGMSKKKLTYMILLEGLLAVIISTVLGCIFGSIGFYGIYCYVKVIEPSLELVVTPFINIIGVIALLFFIMFMASWLPLQGIQKEIAPALAEADE